jgi:hypothetical protein
MKLTLLLSALVIALAGCGSKEEAGTPTSEATPNVPASDQQQAAEPQAPGDGPVALPSAGSGAAGEEAKTPEGKPDLDALTRQLRGWMMSNRVGPPKSFDAWAAAAGIKVPPPPPGKKYAISKTAWVILEDK